MKSMTGFGRGCCSAEEFDITVDASSVNRRSLEVSVGLPREWQGLERRISELSKEFFSRGKVQISCAVRMKGDSAGVDFESLKSAFSALKKNAEMLGVEFKPDLNTLIELGKTIGTSFRNADNLDALWDCIKPAFETAFKELSNMRQREGAALKEDLKERISVLLGFADRLKELSASRPASYKEMLLSKLAKLGLNLDLNDERVLKEVCLFADKCDVAEELTRIKSHLGQFLSALDEPSAVGRKLDFICQELGREINTASNKAVDYEFSKIAVDFKNELERIREQVQNIE